jgi:hypothetical protein
MPILNAIRFCEHKWLIFPTFPPFFSHNKIGELDSSSLAGLNRLTWLDLSNNRINLIQELRRPPMVSLVDEILPGVDEIQPSVDEV